MIDRWFPGTLKIVVFGGLLLLAALWIEYNLPVELSVPTGSFAVGRWTTAWVDEDRIDPFAASAGQKRELVVWIWYPAAAGKSGAVRDDYLPPPIRAEVDSHTPALFRFLTRNRSKVHAHSIRNADVSPRERSYPVVIMRAGASSGVWNYSTLAEDLASHGYVVVGFDAPYRTQVVVFPDGRVMSRLPENNAERCEEQPLAQQSGCVNKLLNGWTPTSGSHSIVWSE
jgi:hypothetical protein